MEGLQPVDVFATKGLEYVLVLAFLLAFVFFWRFLQSSQERQVVRVSQGVRPPGEWFRLDQSRYYHPGHAWALPEEGGVVRVGLDDFAQKLVGVPRALDLPSPGTKVAQGEEGWKLDVGSTPIAMLSPVTGEVVSVNQRVVESPYLIDEDPYAGWLMKVRVPELRPVLRNLLSGNVAAAWLDETVRVLRERMAGDLGVVLQDGGLPVSGFGAYLSPGDWEKIAAEFLLTN